jgi:hypothetical protein
MAVRSEKEIQAELDRIRDAVNDGKSDEADVIWTALRWALGEESVESPVDSHVDEDLITSV